MTFSSLRCGGRYVRQIQSVFLLPCRLLRDTPVTFAALSLSFLMKLKDPLWLLVQGQHSCSFHFLDVKLIFFSKSKQLEVLRKIWLLITRLKLRRKLFLWVTYTKNFSTCSNNLFSCTDSVSQHVDVLGLCQFKFTSFSFHLAN
jgi:hypothetical protein